MTYSTTAMVQFNLDEHPDLHSLQLSLQQVFYTGTGVLLGNCILFLARETWLSLELDISALATVACKTILLSYWPATISVEGSRNTVAETGSIRTVTVLEHMPLFIIRYIHKHIEYVRVCLKNALRILMCCLMYILQVDTPPLP